jgi:hypothetical protein
MPSWVIAFLFAIGGATWVYSKLMRSTGNNTSSVLVASGIAFLFLFLILWSVLSFFVK